MTLVTSAVGALLHLLVTTVVVGPVIWWTARRRSGPVLGPQGWRHLALAGVFYVAAHMVLRLPRVGPLAELQWNWQNKLLLAALMVLLVHLSPALTWSQVGVRRPRRGWLVTLLAVVAAFALQLLVGPLSAITPTTETVWYQAIVPGLDEELMYRGLLLVLLGRALAPRRAMWHGQVGWAVPISCLLFGLVHGLILDDGFILTVDPAAIVASALIGLLLVWVRIRWDSLLPAVLLHNGWNSSVVAATALT